MKVKGTIHIRVGSHGTKMYCGVDHPDASFVSTSTINKSSCPQCIQAYRESHAASERRGSQRRQGK